MLTFNRLLQIEGIDTARVRLVRHQDTRRPGRPTPYSLWRAEDGRLELYQRIQRRDVFAVGQLLASFVATPMNETLFIGLYSVKGSGPVPSGIVDPIGQDDEDTSQYMFYEIEPDSRLSAYAGRLTVSWGDGFRAWVQRADRQDKEIVEIRKAVADPPFPGFTNFFWDVDDIAAIPLAWQEVLKSVKGVYLLVCKETGLQYVGSAKGDESLWGRFLCYAQTGDGGNVELRRRGKKPYKVSVLEIANSDIGIEKIEEAWKKKLMSREFGLNRN
jgi:hypothetical protein